MGGKEEGRGKGVVLDRAIKGAFQTTMSSVFIGHVVIVSFSPFQTFWLFLFVGACFSNLHDE